MALLFTINFISKPLTITPTPFSMHYILFTAGVYRKEIVEKSTNKWIMAALKVHQKHKEGKEDHNFPRDHAVHFCVPLLLLLVLHIRGDTFSEEKCHFVFNSVIIKAI